MRLSAWSPTVLPLYCLSFYLHSRFSISLICYLSSRLDLYLKSLKKSGITFLLFFFFCLPAFCSSSVLPTRICNCMAGKPVKWHCVCRCCCCCFLANAKSRVLNEPNTTGSTAHCKAYWPCHRPHLHCDLPSLSSSHLLVSLSPSLFSLTHCTVHRYLCLLIASCLCTSICSRCRTVTFAKESQYLTSQIFTSRLSAVALFPLLFIFLLLLLFLFLFLLLSFAPRFALSQ